jgi:hypothetical protein
MNTMVSTPITSLYISHINPDIDANYIANVFRNSGIATVSRVAIEQNKSIFRRGLPKLYQAFIDVKEWHDTEVAFNFLSRLRKFNLETRLVYNNSDDDWWVVQINTCPHKTDYNSRKRHLTIFKDPVEKYAKLPPSLEKPCRMNDIYDLDVPNTERTCRESFDSLESCFDYYLREIDDFRNF